MISDLDELVSIDRQKDELIRNTLNFINDKGANHALLWGEMGCGKSSLVRAVFCKFIDRNLRLIEISKFELVNLYKVLDKIRDKKRFKFIIFCDDFSFEARYISNFFAWNVHVARSDRSSRTTHPVKQSNFSKLEQDKNK